MFKPIDGISREVRLIGWRLFDDGWSQRIVLVGHLMLYLLCFGITIRDAFVYSLNVSTHLMLIVSWSLVLLLHFSGYFYRRGRNSKYQVGTAQELNAYRQGFRAGMQHAEKLALDRSLDQLMVGADGEIVEKPAEQKEKQRPKHSLRRRRF